MWTGRTWPELAERQLLRRIRSWWADLLAFSLLGLVLSGIIVIGARWFAPPLPGASITLSLTTLPLYTLYSLSRMLIAYFLSLTFAIAYGRLAASDPVLERILLPLLDVLQSIPILSFMPGVVLALVGLFPHWNLGAELAAIVLIFTSQSWNLAFSVYQSLATIPVELREAAEILHLSRWQRFTRLELPFSLVPLVWNSIMSWAGGWFFLMAAEQFTLGGRSFLLPGLGAYLALAANQGNFVALGVGLAALVTLIVALDQVVWRPLVVWANRFKVEELGETVHVSGNRFAWMRHSWMLRWLGRVLVSFLVEPLDRWCNQVWGYPRSKTVQQQSQLAPRRLWFWIVVGILTCTGGVFTLLVKSKGVTFVTPPLGSWGTIARAAGLSLLRVFLTVGLGVFWAVPVGVMIGLHKRLASLVQPWVQTLASLPATAFFPAIVLVLLHLPGGLQIAGIILMSLGTHWYILFNVIAGASAIPGELREVAAITQLSSWQRWRLLIFPAIFPYLVTGLITAAGGAWNATIVAEYITFHDQVYDAGGLGALIARSAETGDYRSLFTATMVMAAVVVSLNRGFWRRLYRLAVERYRLEK